MMMDTSSEVIPFINIHKQQLRLYDTIKIMFKDALHDKESKSNKHQLRLYNKQSLNKWLKKHFIDF